MSILMYSITDGASLLNVTEVSLGSMQLSTPVQLQIQIPFLVQNSPVLDKQNFKVEKWKRN